MTMLIVNTLLPFIVILFCYVVIFKKVKNVFIRRQQPTCMLGPLLGPQQTTPTIGPNLKTERGHFKKTKIAFLIVGAYIVCWGPSFIYNLLLTLCPQSCFFASYGGSKTEEIVGFVTKLLTFINGLVAPTIYCCGNAHFNALRKRMYSSIRKRFSQKESVSTLIRVGVRKNSVCGSLRLFIGANGSRNVTRPSEKAAEAVDSESE